MSDSPLKIGSDGKLHFEIDLPGPIDLEVNLEGETRLETEIGGLDVGLTDQQVQLDTGVFEADLIPKKDEDKD